MARALRYDRPTTILDFGCGVGNTTRSLSARFSESTVTGFDVSEESVERARRSTLSTNTRYVGSSGDRLPFADQTFEAAFTSCVFHHIEPENRLHWAQELRRVLAPGAPVFLFEHNPWNPLTVRVVRSIPFDEGVELLQPRYTVRLLQSAGFKSSQPWFYFFFPAVLRVLRPVEHWLKRVPIGAQYFVVGRAK